MDGSNESVVPGDDICASLFKIPLPNDEAASTWLYTNTDKIIYTYCIPIVVGLGLIGNCAFLFMVGRLSRMKTTVNFYLVNLALTDIVFLTSQSLFLMYVYFITPVSYNYPFKTVQSCNIIYFIGYISYYCSISIITLVSVERYLAICRPLYHRRMQSRSYTVRVMSVAWFVSAVLTAITVLKRGRLVKFCLVWPDTDKYQDIPSVYRVCAPVGGFDEIVIATEIMYSVIFFVAAFLNGSLYAQIILTLSSRSVATQVADTKTASVRNQVARALVINGIIFFVTQIPIRVRDIYEILDELDQPLFLTKDQASILLSFSLLFLFLNSALNPYVYAFSSAAYRQGFLDAFSVTLKSFGSSETDDQHSVRSVTSNTVNTKV